MIKSKRRINKAMLVANVIAYRSAPFYDALAFYSMKHRDFLSTPATTVAAGWREYGWMVNEAGRGGRWSETGCDTGRTERMGYRRVSV